MPTFSTFLVMRWRVAWEGQVPTVTAQDPPPPRVTMLVPDGASATDAQVLAKYLSGLANDAARKEAIEAMSDGLITVTQLSNVTVTAPAVPASLHGKGPAAKKKAKG